MSWPRDEPPRRVNLGLIAVDVTMVCDHFVVDGQLDPPLDVCPSCVEIGAHWEHLRQCPDLRADELLQPQPAPACHGPFPGDRAIR